MSNDNCMFCLGFEKVITVGQIKIHDDETLLVDNPSERSRGRKRHHAID